MAQIIASGPNFDATHQDTIIGLHGTIGEQQDESHYDQRCNEDNYDDDDDDFFSSSSGCKKIRTIRFPRDQLYGRDDEVKTLMKIYNEHCCVDNSSTTTTTTTASAEEEHKMEEEEASAPPKSSSSSTARIVFLSGLSGTGKSALVHEMFKQISSLPKSSNNRPLIGCGKFKQYGESSVPFHAISDILETYSHDLLLQHDENKNKILKRSLKKYNLGPNDEDCAVLCGMFPILAPLLRPQDDDDENENENDAALISSSPQEDSSASRESLSSSHTSSGKEKKHRNKDRNSRHPHDVVDMIRLKIVFCNFILALQRKSSRPMILFLDDLQWADEASLEILTFLLKNNHKALKHFLFIGSHRSNEVLRYEGHPYRKFMMEIEEGLKLLQKKEKNDGVDSSSSNAVVVVEKMELSGLLPQDIARFVSDCTQRTMEDVQPIVELIYKKTLGNIFFVIQAIEQLVRRNILYYDIICYQWQWNLETSSSSSPNHHEVLVELENFVSEDVVDMIKSKISSLTLECQRCLVMMAYTQNTISARTVLALMQADAAAAAGSSGGGDGHHTFGLTRVLKLLNEAAGEGLLLKTTQNTHEYTFAHDRIQEAAYSSVLKGEEQDRLMVQVAKVLVDRSSSSRDDGGASGGEEWMVFVAAKHLNSVPKERIECLESLAALNLRVANLATSKASLAQAVDLLRCGVACLEPKRRWGSKLYDLTLDLFNRLIVAEFLLGNYERSEAAIDEVLKNATSLQEKAAAHLHLVNIAALKNNRDYGAGVRKGLELLKEYGHQIPLCPSKTNLVVERAKLKCVRGNRSLIKLVDMPIMHDDSVMKLFELTLKYEYMGSGCPRLSTMIMLRALNVSFSQGKSWDLAILALSYAVSMNKKDKPKEANLFSTLAANLQKQFPEALRGGDYVQFQFRLLSCSKLRHPFQEDIGCFPELHQKALSNGLVDIGMACGLIYANCYFAAGLPLNSLLGTKLLLYEQRAVQMNQDSFCLMFKVCRQFLLNLMGRSDGKLTVLEGAAFHEEETLSQLEGNSKKMALRDISMFRLQLAYIFNDEDTVVEMLERLKGYPLADLSVARGFLRVTFIGLGAVLLGTRKKKREYLDLGRKVLKRYKKLVDAGGSANALPPYLCVKAVMKPSRVLYDKAIKACSDADMIHLEAMMCERCGELMKIVNDDQSMEKYLTKALLLYNDWGAFAKVKQLKEQYDFLSGSKLKWKAPTSTSATSSLRAYWCPAA